MKKNDGYWQSVVKAIFFVVIAIVLFVVGMFFDVKTSDGRIMMVLSALGSLGVAKFFWDVRHCDGSNEVASLRNNQHTHAGCAQICPKCGGEMKLSPSGQLYCSQWPWCEGKL